MAPRNTYGKRQTAQERLAEQIFAASSSPIKQSPIRALRETPERKKRWEAEIETASPASSREPEGLRTMDSIVEELGELRLESKEKNHDVDSRNVNLTTGVPRKALHERDANTKSQGPRRQRKDLRSSPLRPTSLDPIVKTGALRIIPDTPPPATPPPRRRRLVQRKRQQSLIPATLPPTPPSASADPLTAYASPLLDLCFKPSITPFTTYANDLSTHFAITKIAEASYGEVYRLSLLSHHASLNRTDESVLKIVALKSAPTKDAQPQSVAANRKAAAMSSIPDVANEVRLLQHMTPIPGFTNFRCLTVVRGRLPPPFVKAWKHYHNNVKRSLFPNPAAKTSYSEDQLWAVLEMQDAGTDVETYLECAILEGVKASVVAVWDVFWSVAGAVAKGEEYAGFEHRDLHVGNICVRRREKQALPDTNTNSASAAANVLTSIFSPATAAHGDDERRTIHFTELETTIIDYTLSRAEISSEQDIAYFDLSKDSAIFEGDAKEEYQYDIYRFMRAAVVCGDPAASITRLREALGLPVKGRPKKKGKSGGTRRRKEWTVVEEAGWKGVCEADAWRAPCKVTNLLWLHFVLTKLMEALPSRSEVGESAKVESILRERLNTLSNVLAIERLAKCGLKSAIDLLGWAVSEKWLTEEDVLGIGN